MSASINEISIRSPLAAIANGLHLRVYQLAVDGGVREALYEGRWTGGLAKNTIGTVRLNSSLAATALKLDHIRVYGIDNNSTIIEFAFDTGKGWHQTGMTGQFKVAPYSAIGAVVLGTNLTLRVYAQMPDNTIQEYAWDGNGWYKGQNFGEALPGTDIAATSWIESDNRIGLCIYFQDKDKKMIEKYYDDAARKWVTGGFSFQSNVTRASLAAVSWAGSHHRVYYSTPDNRIKEKCWDNTGEWTDGGFDYGVLPASNVATTTIGGIGLRVYLQNGADNTAITEFVFTDRWSIGNPALPPA
jgi:hypothetical protein